MNAIGEPGIALIPRAGPALSADRASPRTSSASRTSTVTALPGAERAFDKYLSDPATRGQPLKLSISSRIQQALEHELARCDDEFSAIGAAGVVMDVHTGEVLAMTSIPTLNPNAPGQGDSGGPTSIALLSASIELARPSSRSRVAMAMDSGVIKAVGQIYNCPNELHVYGHIVHDTHPFGRTVHRLRDHDGKLEHRHCRRSPISSGRRGRRRCSRRWASSTGSRSSSGSVAVR